MLETVFLSEKYAVKTVSDSHGYNFRIAINSDNSTSRTLFEWNVRIYSEAPEAESDPEVKCNHNDQREVFDSNRWSNPSHRDSLSISFVASSIECRSLVSSVEIHAVILWSTLYWYFHQEPPDTKLITSASSKTPHSGRPKENWRICVARHGSFENSCLLSRMEKLRLVASDSLSSQNNRPAVRSSYLFASRCTFWQLDSNIYLTLLSSIAGFSEMNCLSTCSPPMPLQYVMSNGIRHPIRPKRPCQGEQFYTRFVNSLGQVLSFRVASALQHSNPLHDPFKQLSISEHTLQANVSGGMKLNTGDYITALNDVALLYKWMNEPRVSRFWGMEGPRKVQDEFLAKALASKHSFPIIGYWDDKPFGYFELYWVKEDILGQYLGNDADDWDRGIHCLVGEQDFRGPHRVKAWLSALVHYSFLADDRTRAVMLEPRVDNLRLVLIFYND